MRKAARVFSTAASVAVLLGTVLTSNVYAQSAESQAKPASSIEEGKKIAFDRKKGNCLACHQMDDGVLPGDIGPPLVAMKIRFPDKAKLRAQISDPHQANPNSVMPPFGRNRVLTEAEIDKVVEYIHSL